MRCLFALGLGLVLASTARAQPYVAFPVDGLHGRAGQSIPLGVYTLPQFDEARTQHLIPAAYLPSRGGLITALEVAPHLTGSVPYKSLVIALGHTTATSLDRVFARNLPKPTVVLKRVNTSIRYPSATAWVRLPLDTPFAYDGTGNLVIEIRKQVNRSALSPASTVTHQITSFPVRGDLPLPLAAHGTSGSGQSSASRGTHLDARDRLLWRLRFRNTPTLSITSTRSAPHAHYFHRGSRVTLTVQGDPGNAFLDAIETGLVSPPISIPGVGGAYRLQSFAYLFWMGAIPASGRGDFALIVPNELALVGAHFYFQSAAIGHAIDLTNVVDAIVAR